MYQPQLESWKGHDLSGRAAVSVKDAASPDEQFGVIWFTAKTNVNRAENLVTLEDIAITKGSFPATPDKTDQYVQALQASAPQQMADLSLAHLQAEITVAQAESAPQKPVAVKNDVPKIYFSTQPAVLVQVDGQPVLRQVSGYNLLRVINTYAVLLFDQSQGTYYLHVVGKWAQAQSLDGPWTVSSRPPANLERDPEDGHQGRASQRPRRPGRVRHSIGRAGHLPDDLRQHGAGGAHHDARGSLV